MMTGLCAIPTMPFAQEHAKLGMIKNIGLAILCFAHTIRFMDIILVSKTYNL